MTTEVWPDIFPSPQFEDYGLEPFENIARTQMESGTARQRKRFSRVPTSAPLSFKMSAYTFAIFESWYKFRAKEGAEWFLMDLQVGMGFIEHEVRFTKPYKARILSISNFGQEAIWQVNIDVEIREQRTLDAGALSILLDGSTVPGIEAVSDRLHKLIHIDLAPGGQYVW